MPNSVGMGFAVVKMGVKCTRVKIKEYFRGMLSTFSWKERLHLWAKDPPSIRES